MRAVVIKESTPYNLEESLNRLLRQAEQNGDRIEGVSHSSGKHPNGFMVYTAIVTYTPIMGKGLRQKLTHNE